MELQTEQEFDASLESEIVNGFSTLPVSDDEESKTISSQDVSYLDNSIQNGENSEVLTLLKLYKKVCKQRLSSIDENDLDSSSKNKESFRILKSYLEQVEEQNDVLAATLIELEKEANKRVKQMEKRLKSTAKTTMEAVINIHEYEKEMRKLVQERLSMQSIISNMQQQYSSLKVENSYLQDQNCNLSHDLQALLHIIQHARSTGHWEMSCVTFCEVTPEQIFGPVQSLSQMYSNESPISDFHLPDEEHKDIHSDLSSQDVPHPHSRNSCQNFNNSIKLSSDPVINSEFSTDASHMILNKNRKIKKLESRISELQHELTVKEAECECHLWKIELLMQHNQNRYICRTECPSSDIAVQKCISLPDIGNIYSYANVLRKSHSCRMSVAHPNSLIKSPKINPRYKHGCIRKKNERSEVQVNKYSSIKHDKMPGVHRAQSEPYLFMFGDNVYVYRPCEPIKKASNVALCNDYHLSLPPCQSIDLKFPVDDSSLKICDWDAIFKKTISCSISQASCRKDDDLSSYTSNGSIINEILDMSNNDNNQYMHQSRVTSDSKHCSRDQRLQYSVKEINSNSGSKFSFNQVSLSVQTDETIAFNSIGVQADICENADVDLVSENLFELDLSHLRKTITTLKDTVLKAEDKAEAKSILIEQLQGHITSAIKEVELKDQALINVERKLDISRNEISVLREKYELLKENNEQLKKELENFQILNDNMKLKVSAKEEKIQELNEEQKVFQNQKRALMTQLDIQGDEYENVKAELHYLKNKVDGYILQIDLQNQTIRNLQEAIVQSKRASSNASSKISTPGNVSSTMLNDSKNSSRSSIVDV